MERGCCSSSSVLHRGNVMYVEVVLQGGAPWGFTLKGGLEHGETLIISKVEEDGKADQLQHPLQPGDQIVIINQVELSGSRQEAISLVKGSYKTLHLIVSRRSDPASRPHSWHSTKLREGLQDPAMEEMSQASMGAPWHQTYHSSCSTTDLSAYGTGLLRRSPDQYSSRGSMESLDHGHLAYSSCHQLSPSKSSNSIDHLHNKRDSAYSSFSNSSSIPEYPAAGPSFNKERSYSMESMLSQRGPEALRQADIRYVRTVYDPQQGISEEHEVTSAKLLRNHEARAHADVRGGVSGGPLNHSAGAGSWSSLSSRNSYGCLWGQTNSRDSYDSLKGVPAPPLRSDSYTVIKNHERPNSWSSLEQTRSSRGLQKGFWHHSSGSVSSMKPPFMAEGQLHTVVEKSPESSPTTKPKQNCTPTSQPVRFMLPTGIYPVPQPEPHYAQVPTCYPTSGSMYPALAKESMCPSHREHNRELNVDGPVTENINQSNTLSKPPTLPKPKQLMHHDGKRHEDSEAIYNHHGRMSKSSVDVCQMQNPDSGYRPALQERRDPYTRVKQRVEKQKHSQSFENPGPEDSVKLTAWSHHQDVTQFQDEFLSSEVQGGIECLLESNGRYSALSSHKDGPGSNYNHTSDSLNCTSHILCSDSEALEQQKQQDHPLTQLENALVQVQNSQASLVQGNSQNEGTETDAMHLSVLEKVSRFEQRGQRMMQSQNYINRNHIGAGFVRPSHPCSTKTPYSCSDDISQRAEQRDSVSTMTMSNIKMQNCSTEGKGTMSHGDSEAQQFLPALQMCGNQEPPLRNHRSRAMVIQRSKSTFQLGEQNDQEFHWKEDLEEISGTTKDPSFNRTYRDSIKDAQSKVLRSTSFRRNDLRASPSPSSKHLSLERKPPKTNSTPCTVSPHTPKERHIVAPEVEENSPPPLPKLPAVGPPVTRIGGRKRLTLQQKSRSYSEPDKMHEVGLLDNEVSQRVASQQVFFPETSVADKRKIFEMAATNSTRPSLSKSRPDLKQIQHDALSDYMERKTGRRPAGRSRPTSIYVQPSCLDSQSLCSSSSFASLQEPPFNWPSRSEREVAPSRLSSTLPAGSKNAMYVDKNTSHPQPPSGNPASLPKQQSMMRDICASEREHQKCERESYFVPRHYSLLPQHEDKAFQSIAPSRDSGKSASAEDLLEASEEKWSIPKHHRSQSSPSVERFIKDLIAGDHTEFEISSKESSLTTQRENRSENAEPKAEVYMGKPERSVLGEGRAQLSGPAARRDRKGHSERQKAHSSTGLAASVGLPSSFCPGPSSTDLDWQAGKGLLQPGLDSLTSDAFLRQDSRRGSEGGSQALLSVVSSRRSTDASPSDFKDGPSSRVPVAPKNNVSLCAPESHALLSGTFRDTSSRTDSCPSAEPPPLPLVCVPEASLSTYPPLHFSKGDDCVSLTGPDEPPLPSPPIRETDITEDFVLHTAEVPSVEDGHSVISQNGTVFAGGMVKHLPGLSNDPANCDLPLVWAIMPSLTKAEAQSAVSIAQQKEQEAVQQGDAVCPEQDGLEENPVLCRRERLPEELRVEALARLLVSKDKSLSPILGTWAVKSTVDLMEGIFPSLTRLSQQQRKSSQEEDRWGGEDMWLQAEDRGMVTDLDEAEADLNQKKAQLMEALGLSIAALQEEKERLAEEQRRFGALESRVEDLVRQRCKPNESDKYHMFVGDLDKIVNLLLSLCGRLARVENALAALDGQRTEDIDKERETLQLKRRQLWAQHEDARELKRNLDRRGLVVLRILDGYLSACQLHDYTHFVRMKPALLIRQRCLDDLIRQGEEQLQGLAARSATTGSTHTGATVAPLTPASPSCRSTAVTSL